MKILTLNLCTSIPGHSAKGRLDTAASFVRAEGVDVLLLQEGLRVCTVYDRTRYLADAIDRGDDWCYRGYIGVPWFYVWQVGIISRFPIVSVDSVYLEVPQKEWLDSLPFPGRRRAVIAKVQVPGVGIVAFCSVHLSSSPKTEADRQTQFTMLADHLGQMEADAIVLGGDFNTELSNPAFICLRHLGLDNAHGLTPDYIVANRGTIASSRLVLTEGVTDHAGGVLVDWQS